MVDFDGPTLIYEKQISSEICTGISSLQFKRCNFHGFEKNVLVVGTKDSSVLTIDSDSGNAVCTNPIQPNKPSKALFMKVLGIACRSYIIFHYFVSHLRTIIVSYYWSLQYEMPMGNKGINFFVRWPLH